MTDRLLPGGVTRSGAPETIAVADIGGTSVKIGFARRGRPLDFTRSHPTGVLRDGDPASTLAALLRSAAGEAALAPDSAVVAVPGLLDKDFDTVLHAANVPMLSGVRLSSGLSARLGMPVLLERDVALQLLGEAIAGAVAGEREVLAVYIGTGIGAAYLGRNGLFRGGGWALEIGHMPVRGPQAGSRPGRIEVHASGAALADLAARHGMAVDALFARAGDSPPFRPRSTRCCGTRRWRSRRPQHCSRRR